MESQTQRRERWVMHRAIFYNYWYYPYQEFTFNDGCGVMRGINGAGKSVTTQSLITVLLDGDTSAKRLDPFGGKERKISDTVLGKKDLMKFDHRIGYVALEFIKPNTGMRKTIGIGIEAERDVKKAKIWYFILDDIRVGKGEHDFKLYKQENVNGSIKQIPLNEKQISAYFEENIRSGKVYSERKEYAINVNKQLFGFKRYESFLELLDLLIQLRSPRLSDTEKPEAAAMVLNDSLPSLTDEEIRPLIQSIEAIDKLERDLDEFKRELKLIKNLNNVYSEYNRVMFAEKAEAFFKVAQRFKNTKDKIEKTKKSIENSKLLLSKFREELKKNELLLETAKEEKLNLGLDKIEELQRRMRAEEANYAKLSERLAIIETKIAGTKKEIKNIQEKSDTFDLRKNSLKNELAHYLIELAQLNELVDFNQHNRFYDHFSNSTDSESYSFEAWENASKEYKYTLTNFKKELEIIQKYHQKDLDLKNTIGNIQLQIDLVSDEIAKNENNLVNLVYDKKEEVISWLVGLEHLKLSDVTKNDLLGNLSGLYDEITEEEYKKPLLEDFESQKSSIQTDIIRTEVSLNEVEEKIRQVTQEIQIWLNKTEIEPPAVSTRKESWQKLKDANIPFTPFYEMFEFNNGLTDEEKASIQDALFETGLLTSVIVPEDRVSDASLITSVVHYCEPKVSNLTSVLKPSNASDEEAVRILEGISFSPTLDGTGFIMNSGQFDNTLVFGQSASYGKDIYIGITARENYRKNRIAELNTEKDLLTIEKDTFKEKISLLKGWLNRIEEEVLSFPKTEELKEIIDFILSEKNKISMILEPELQRKEEELEKNNKELKSRTASLKNSMPDYTGPLDLETVSNKIQAMEDYRECLRNLKEAQLTTRNIDIHLTNLKGQLKREEENLDEYYYNFDTTKDELSKSRIYIDNLKKRLKEIGQEDAQRKLKELTNLIDVELPKKRDELIGNEKNELLKIQTKEESIVHLEEVELPFEKALFEAWERDFLDNLKLEIFDLEEVEKGSLVEKAEYILANYKPFSEKGTNKLSMVKRNLNNQFLSRKADLPRYQIEMETVESDLLDGIQTKSDEQERDIQLAREQMVRYDITLLFDNIRTSPQRVEERLEEHVAMLEMDANERDRDLYQNILINTLGDKISRKINYVKMWQKEMNRYMEHENIIKFRLQWVPKKSEKEGEMDTRRLVDALMKESKWVDIEEISKHFRSKITKAKRQFDSGTEVDLQKVMREVLDYRNWFEFEIYFTLFNESEQKLSKKTYDLLSGGQKVLAMITPVLAALNAKYEEAAEDAPRIFTLDEAFSRVDNININALFKYIHKLQFNYILNSQSLWGTFESVPSLNIYELSRPNNRPFVVVQSYYWNGVERIRETKKQERTLGLKKEVM